MRLLTARRVGTCGCSQLSSNPATCLHLHRRGWPSFRIYTQDEAAGTGRRRSSRVPGAVTHLSDCLLGGGPTAHWRGRLHPGAEDCALRPAQALLLKNDSDPCPAAGSPGHDERSRAPNSQAVGFPRLCWGIARTTRNETGPGLAAVATPSCSALGFRTGSGSLPVNVARVP